jgi:hypothetical protein
MQSELELKFLCSILAPDFMISQVYLFHFLSILLSRCGKGSLNQLSESSLKIQPDGPAEKD